MREKLKFPSGQEVRLWLYANRGPIHFMHSHEDLEINLAVRGEAAYLVKDQRYRLTPGTLLWLFPDQEHLLIEQSGDFQMWILVFRRSFTRRVCGESASVLTGRDPGTMCVQLSEQGLRRLRSLYGDLLEAQLDRPRLHAGAAYALLETFALHQRAEERAPVRRVHPAIEKAARLLHQEPSRYSLTSLSREVELSPSRLSRLFKRQMGLTLVCYRQRRTLEKFLDLFSRSPNRKLTSLALEAGFGSYPQFHRVFRKEMGRGPGQFIRNG